MADLARQQDHAAIDRQSPDARFGQAERCVHGGHNDIAAEQHLQTAAERMAVHPRDHRDVKRGAQ